MSHKFIRFTQVSKTRKSEIRISKHETNSNDQNINDQNGKRHHQSAFVLNFEHLNFDIVSDFDIRIFTTVIAFRQHVKSPKSNLELMRHSTSVMSTILCHFEGVITTEKS